MALVLIDSPGNFPADTTDWNKINSVFQAIGLGYLRPFMTSGAYVVKGSVLFYAGAWYVSDVDTAITETPSAYIKIINTAGVLSVEYATSLTGVAWNVDWGGWYDASNNYYIFDEVKAYAEGLLYPKTLQGWRPSVNVSKILSQIGGDNWELILNKDIEVETTANDIVIGAPSASYINYNRGAYAAKDAKTFLSNTWITLYTFTLYSSQYLPAKLTAFRFEYTNADPDSEDTVVVKQGSTDLLTFHAEASKTVDIVMDTTLSGVLSFSVVYRIDGSGYKDAGPWGLTISIGLVDDLDKPSMQEYIFNSANTVTPMVTVTAAT